MPKIIFNHIKEGFSVLSKEKQLQCVSQSSHWMYLSFLLASINLFVHNSIFVLISRKGQLSLSSCKVLFLFHNCYYCYCWNFWILIFTLLRALRITVWRSPKEVFYYIFFYCIPFSGSVGHNCIYQDRKSFTTSLV